MEVTPSQPSTAATRRWIGRALRATVSLAALVYLGVTVDLGSVGDSLRRLPFGHLLAAEACVAGSMAIGAYRHRALLGAYGAHARPSLSDCLRLYWIGFFYNTFLPGAVGGDVLRAVGAREAFGRDGTAASFAVVLVERVLGLFGLVIVASVAFAIHPLEGVRGVSALAALGAVAALFGVGAVALGRRLASVVPGVLGRTLGRLPQLVDPAAFAGAFVASIASHLMVAATGHALISGLADSVTPATSAVVVPVGAAAAFFPLSIAGLGVREAAFARLYELADVPASAAAAFALVYLGVQLAGALVGGVLSWFERHPA